MMRLNKYFQHEHRSPGYEMSVSETRELRHLEEAPSESSTTLKYHHYTPNAVITRSTDDQMSSAPSSTSASS